MNRSACLSTGPEAPPLAPGRLCRMALLGTLLLAGLPACKPPAAQDAGARDEAALARVGAGSIPEAAFRRELERRARLEPGRYDSLDARRRLLEEMIQFEALHQKALAAGYADREDIRQKVRRLIVSRYEEDQIAAMKPVVVEPQEVEDYYRKHGDRNGTPGRVRVALVRIDCPRTADEEQRAELQARADQARAEALARAGEAGGFGSVVRMFSDHQASRYRGGDVGWLSLGTIAATWPAEVMTAASRLARPGDISPVVAAPDGFYLVKLLERAEAGVRPLEQIRPGLEHQLVREREQARLEAWRAAALQGLDIRVNLEQLAALLPPTPKGKLPPSPTGRPVAQSSQP